MNILVINGSPKGKYSTTLQTVLYLEKKFPEHSFQYLNAAGQIKSLEKDFTKTAGLIQKADLLLFSYPVYTFLVPSQLHRFIELLKSKCPDLSGKYATQITTSKHFYDVTAHRFIEENSMDMGLKFIKGLSADMDDLLTEEGRADALRFFRYLLWSVENDVYESFPAKAESTPPVPVGKAQQREKKEKGDVVIVADLAEDDTQLSGMIERFRAVLPLSSRIVNIRSFPFKGGCLSCFNCAAKGECIYKDGFQELLRDNIQTADAIVLAFRIKDHSMGSVFKTYDDRQFCNGHRTVTMGKPFGYIVSGNLMCESNLRMVIDARAEVGGNFLAGVATDEKNPDGEIDRLAERLSYAVEEHYTQPSNFYGVGGMKIFRDLIWLMQGMMKADHRFYRSHSQYDFPQKKVGTMLKMYLVGSLFTNPEIKKKIGGKMNEGMIAPYKKVLDKK